MSPPIVRGLRMRVSAGSPVSAATTRSIRMKREPLTSTDAAARRLARARRAAPRRRRSARAPANGAAVFALSAPAAHSDSMPRSLRIGADLAMERRPLVADLAHVAEHEPARRRQRGEDVDRGAHRIGVGVVAVVDQRDRRRRRARSASSASGRAPARSLRGRARSPRAGSPRRARAASPRARCGRCAGRRRRSAKVARAGRRLHRHDPVVAVPDGAAGHVGRRRRARSVIVRRAPASSRQIGACASSAGKTATPSAPSASIARAVLARDRLDARHELQVLALRVVDERDRRRGDLRQAGDLAGVVHAELDDRRRGSLRAGAAASAARRCRC